MIRAHSIIQQRCWVTGMEKGQVIRFLVQVLRTMGEAEYQAYLSDLKIYVSAENLFTVTSYSGLDPESTDLIDYGTYPQARSFLFGVNVKF